MEYSYLENGCVVPKGYKGNFDGYVRVPDHRRKLSNGRYARIMYHRLVWEQKYGDVPEDCSLHHVCRNRACCNTDHIVLMTKTEHAKLHNTERYSDRKDRAKEYWMADKTITGTALGAMFGVSFSIGCRWIREWRMNNDCH